MNILYERFGTPLKDWDIRINYGVKTGCNEAFIIDQQVRDKLIAADPKSAEIIRPILRGKDIKRNDCVFADKYLICTFPAAHIDINEYPAIKHYFESASWSGEIPLNYGKMKLEQNGEEHCINGVTFKSRKKTQNQWFETQDQIAYMDDFSKQKIMYAEIVQSPRFYLDDSGFIPEATAFYLAGEHLDYLINYLNSPIIAWCFKRYYAGGGLGETGFRYKKAFILNLPIPRLFDADKIDNNYLFSVYGFTRDEIAFIESSL